MKRLLLAFAFILASVTDLHGQGAALTNVILGPNVQVRPNAYVTICSHPSTVLTCPANAIALYSDLELHIPTTNPTMTNAQGNFLAYAAAGTFDYIVTGPGVTPQAEVFTMTAGGSGGGGSPAGSDDDVQTKASSTTFGSGVASTANVGVVGNIAVKAGATDGVQFVCSTGNDSNDGLSRGTAKLTVYTAWNALPAAGGTIEMCGSVQVGNPLGSTYGLQIMGSADPNWSNITGPANGWLGMPNSPRAVKIACYDPNAASSFSATPQCRESWGNPANTTQPSLWLSGFSAGSLEFDNITFLGAGRSANIGIDSTGANSHAGGVQEVTFDSASFTMNQGASLGPDVLIGDNTFFVYFKGQTFIQGNSVSATPSSDGAYALVINPTNGSGLIFFDYLLTSAGGVRAYQGVSAGTGLYISQMNTENQLQAQVDLPAPITILRVSNTEISDCSPSGGNTCNAIQIDSGGCLGFCSMVVSNISGNISNPAAATLEVASGYGNNGNYVTVPAANGLEGNFFGHLNGIQVDATRRNFPPVVVPASNLAATAPASWNITSVCTSCTLTSSQTAPDFTTGAAEVSTSAGGQQSPAFYLGANVPVSVGDAYVYGVWVKSFSSNGFNNTTAVRFVLNAQGYGTGDFCSNGAQSVTNITYLQSGWAYYKGICIVSVAPVNAGPALVGNIDSTHPVVFYAPTIFYIASGTMPLNDMWEIEQNLDSYDSTCATGSICGLEGQNWQLPGSGTLTVPHLILGNVSSGTQCLHANSAGQVTGTGSDCGSGGGAGINITVNGGSNLASPANFQNGPSFQGITINALNPSGSNVDFQLAGVATEAFLPGTTVFTDQLATFGHFAYDFSGASSLKAPVSAGFAPTASGSFGYDSTANDWVFGQNGSKISFGLASSSACAANSFVSTPATAIAIASCTQPAFTNISGIATGAQGGLNVNASAFTGVLREASGTASASELSGDATTSGSNAVTVVKIDGNSVPSGVANNQVMVGTAANTFSFKTLPNCVGSSNALNFTTSTNAFSCLSISTLSNPMTTLGDLIYGGAAGAATALSGPTTPNGVPQFLIDTPSAGAAVAETWSLAGVPVDATNPASLLVTDRANYLNWTSGTTLALPAVTGTFGSNFPFALKNTSTTLTITPNAGASDLIDGASSGTLIPNFAAFVYQDSTSGPGHWFTIKYPTFAAFGSTCTNGLTWSTSTGIGCQTAAPADVALDNLASVNINTSLLAQTGVDAGSTTKAFRNLYLFGSGTYGSTSSEFTATPTGNRVYTFQDSSDTILGRATTDTLTNKTFDTNGTGNVLRIAGTQMTAIAGNTGTLGTTSGAFTSGNCVKSDASHNFIDSGGTCGGGAGTPCTTTGNSLQYDNAGAFGCTAEFTYAASTLSSSTAGIVDLHAATGTAAFRVPSTTTNTATSSATIDYDTTNSNYHANSGADSLIGVVPTASIPSTGHIIDASVVSGKFLLHDSGVVTANVVNASSPGAGVAHFAGSTQTVTSSAVTSADATGNTSGSGNFCLVTSCTMITPALGIPSALTLTNATGLPAASVLSGALANGMTATTQTAASNDTKVATDAYVDGHFIANGTFTLNTAAVGSGACETVVTVSATGVATTDVIGVGFNGDPTAVTGYGASATGAVLSIYPYPTANNVNVKVCNSTANSITPGSMTLNWKVTR